MTTIYLTHSIYHLLLSLSIINTNRDAKSILVLASKNTTQTSANLKKILSDNSAPKNIDIFNVSTEIDQKMKLSVDSLKRISELKTFNIDELIIFNEDDLLAIHLGQCFNKKNVLVSLAQDGMKAYAKINKMALRYRSLRSVDYYKYCKANNFSYSPIYISMKYGKSPYVKKLYLTHLEAFGNKFKKEIEIIKLNSNILKLYSHITKHVELDISKPTIFFASSILTLNPSLDIENKVLKHLSTVYLDYQLIIKLHPRTSQEVQDFYINTFNNWIILYDTIPAEVYINELENCILISGYSGVALFNKQEETIFDKYWLYPLYLNSIKSLGYTTLTKPEESIKIIENWEEFYDVFSN